jgi:hypothetical protein
MLSDVRKSVCRDSLKMVVETRAKEHEARGRASRESRGPQPRAARTRSWRRRSRNGEKLTPAPNAKGVAEEQPASAAPRAEKPVEMSAPRVTPASVLIIGIRLYTSPTR